MSNFSVLFDLSNGNRAIHLMHEKKAELFGEMENNYPASIWKGSQWVRLSGLPAGLYSGTLSVFCRIVALVEPIFKGALNIIGFPVFKKCSLIAGIKQLGVDFPLSALKLVFVMPLEVFVDLTATPLAVLISGKYLEKRAAFEWRLK